METHHTVMREELSLVNARMYGPTRNSATIQAALLAMGTDPGVLVLMEEDGGVWTLDADILIPATVTLSIPAGVTVTGSGNLTIVGGLAAWRLTWYQGTGTVIWAGSAAPQISATLHAGALALGGPVSPLVTLRGTGSAPWTLTLPPGPGTTKQVLTTDGAGVTSWVTVQAADATLQTLADLATAPDTAPYFTATDQAALMTVTPLARQLLDDATIAAMQATLQVQPVDATLTGLAGITTGANLLPYLAGMDQWATTTLSPFARTLLDDLDAPGMRGTLSLGALSTLSTVTTPYITDGAVTLSKLADIPDARLLGRASGNAGPVQTLSVGAGLQLTGGMLQLAGGAIVGTGAANRLGVWSSAGNLTYAENLQFDLPMGQLTSNRVLNSGLASGDYTGTYLGLDITLDAASTARPTGARIITTYRPNGFSATSAGTTHDQVTALRATAVTFGASGELLGGLKGALIQAEHGHSGKLNQITGLHVESLRTGGGLLEHSYGIVVINSAIGAIQTTGVHIGVDVGTARWALMCAGSAASYFGGSLGIGVAPPLYPLDVLGAARLSGALYVGDAPLTRTNLGLGTLAVQNASAVAITGGTAFGMTDIRGGRFVVEWQGAPQQGLYINDGPAGVCSGIFSGVSSGTNRYNINASGTAPNYFGGNVGIGRPPVSGKLELAFVAGQSAVVTYPGTAGPVYPVYFLNVSQVNVGSISTSDTVTAYNTTSDARLKTDVQPLTGALEVVRRLRPITHLWRADGSHGYGFLAHEVQQVVDGVVMGEPDAVDADGQIVPQMIDPSKLVVWLTGAVQDLAQQVASLQTAVTALRGTA